MKTHKLLTLTLVATLFCNLHPQDSQLYEHLQPLAEKIRSFEAVLEHSYGKRNSFHQFASIAQLTLDAHKHVAKQAQSKDATEHDRMVHKELLKIVQQTDFSLSQVLQAFVEHRPREHVMRELVETTQSAARYITTHLEQAVIRKSKYYKRSQKRFLPFVGLGLFSGTFKYIVILIVGGALLTLVWRVYSTIVQEPRSLQKDAKNSANEISDDIKAYNDSLAKLASAVTNKPTSSRWARLKGKFSKNARYANTLKTLDIIEEKQDLFDLDGPAIKKIKQYRKAIKERQKVVQKI